jgi:hypothetical protein
MSVPMPWPVPALVGVLAALVVVALLLLLLLLLLVVVSVVASVAGIVTVARCRSTATAKYTMKSTPCAKHSDTCFKHESE